MHSPLKTETEILMNFGYIAALLKIKSGENILIIQPQKSFPASYIRTANLVPPCWHHAHSRVENSFTVSQPKIITHSFKATVWVDVGGYEKDITRNSFQCKWLLWLFWEVKCSQCSLPFAHHCGSMSVLIFMSSCYNHLKLIMTMKVSDPSPSLKTDDGEEGRVCIMS